MLAAIRVEAGMGGRRGALWAVLLTACGGGRAEMSSGDGPHTRRTADGTLRWEESGGLLEGPATATDPDGQRVYEGRYHRGHRHGPWRFYYEDGITPWMEAQYADGILDGLMRTWRRDGSPEMELRWQHGRPVPPLWWLEPGAAPLAVTELPDNRLPPVVERRHVAPDRAPHCPAAVSQPILQRARDALDLCPGASNVTLIWTGSLRRAPTVIPTAEAPLAPATVHCARKAARDAGPAPGSCAGALFTIHDPSWKSERLWAETDEEKAPYLPVRQGERFGSALRAEVDRCYPEGALAAFPPGQGLSASVEFDAVGRNTRRRILSDAGRPDARACVEQVLAEQAIAPPASARIIFEVMVPKPPR
jgi:hypothetical protein